MGNIKASDLYSVNGLSIVLNTVKMEIRLPAAAERLKDLRLLIKSWRCRKVWWTWRELESLGGHLCHACKVVRPGRRFLRGIFQLISRFSKSHFKICLTVNSELAWSRGTLPSWNGMECQCFTNIQIPSMEWCVWYLGMCRNLQPTVASNQLV